MNNQTPDQTTPAPLTGDGDKKKKIGCVPATLFALVLLAGGGIGSYLKFKKDCPPAPACAEVQASDAKENGAPALDGHQDTGAGNDSGVDATNDSGQDAGVAALAPRAVNVDCDPNKLDDCEKALQKERERLSKFKTLCDEAFQESGKAEERQAGPGITTTEPTSENICPVLLGKDSKLTSKGKGMIDARLKFLKEHPHLRKQGAPASRLTPEEMQTLCDDLNRTDAKGKEVVVVEKVPTPSKGGTDKTGTYFISERACLVNVEGWPAKESITLKKALETGRTNESLCGTPADMRTRYPNFAQPKEADITRITKTGIDTCVEAVNRTGGTCTVDITAVGDQITGGDVNLQAPVDLVPKKGSSAPSKVTPKRTLPAEPPKDSPSEEVPMRDRPNPYDPSTPLG